MPKIISKLSLHPFTPLTLAGCCFVLVTVLNSLTIVIIVLTLTCIGFLLNPSAKVLLGSLALSLPAIFSYFLFYGLFGNPGAVFWLSLRFFTLVSCALVFLSQIDTFVLLRALTPILPAQLLFMLGSVTRLGTIAQQRVRTIKQIQITRGVIPQNTSHIDPHSFSYIDTQISSTSEEQKFQSPPTQNKKIQDSDATLKISKKSSTTSPSQNSHSESFLLRFNGIRKFFTIALPIVVGMIIDATSRARPLSQTGITNPGKRSIFHPVPNPLGEKFFRWFLLTVTIFLVVLKIAGWSVI